MITYCNFVGDSVFDGFCSLPLDNEYRIFQESDFSWTLISIAKILYIIFFKTGYDLNERYNTDGSFKLGFLPIKVYEKSDFKKCDIHCLGKKQITIIKNIYV